MKRLIQHCQVKKLLFFIKNNLKGINSDAQYSIKEGKLDDISKEKSVFLTYYFLFKTYL